MSPSQQFPVELTLTEHMLSRLGRTVKIALKSTKRERQLPRARSAVQRSPVVERHQRTEDFHSRSIRASRSIAGPEAWRKTDGDSGPLRLIAGHDNCVRQIQRLSQRALSHSRTQLSSQRSKLPLWQFSSLSCSALSTIEARDPNAVPSSLSITSLNQSATLLSQPVTYPNPPVDGVEKIAKGAAFPEATHDFTYLLSALTQRRCECSPKPP